MGKRTSEILSASAPCHCGVVEEAGRWTPLHFAYLAGAAARAGVRPILYDAMSKMAGHDDIRRVRAECDAFKAPYLRRSRPLIMVSSFIVETFKRLPLLGAAMEGMMRAVGRSGT